VGCLLDHEIECLRFGVDPDMPRQELLEMVEGSTVELSIEGHREEHAEDFVRWGRRGGLATVRRYGTAWFSLLARRRWERVSAERLAETFAQINGEAAGRP
jgi:hypothetical protein